MSRSSSSFGFRSSFNSSDRKLSREHRKEPPTAKRTHNSNHHDHHVRDPHHHNLHEKRQRSRHDNTEAEKAARSIFGDVPLTDTERRYLWSAQSGNLPALELLVEDAASFNLCCRDYLGRTALQLSLLGEHYDCIQLLLNKLRPDIIEEGLLHAIKSNNVKICDMFLSQPLYSDPRARMQYQQDHQNGLYEQEDSSSSFANDITPIVLAAQCNNFDIVHMLIQKGFTISTPHNYFCFCPECQNFKDQDRVVHSKSRLNAYRGLASTAYLSLSCDDPIYAAFELSRNLEKLAEREKEHKNEYRGLSNQCKDFAVALLDQCRTNDEVMSALHGGTDTYDLSRIKMAIRYDQKKFIAHASCQEQLASMWYSGAPWFQHQSFVTKLLIVPCGIMFIPLTAIIYVFVPYSKLGRILKSPFMKFMNYICSYMAFLVLLFLGTQLTSFQSVHLFNGVEGVVNGLIMFYVLGMFWAECKQLWEEGVHDYFSQMWNYMDITMLALYTAGYSIEGVIYTKADKLQMSDNNLLYWKDYAILNPQILSKILFSVANVMSFARIAYILPASETFGQLQISYGRMLQDVGKFIFIYVTVMIAFICGLTSLYSITTNTNFSGLSETTGTLFWAAFGMGNAKAPSIETSSTDGSSSSNNNNNNNKNGRGVVVGHDGSRNGEGSSNNNGDGGGGGGGGSGSGMTDGEMLKVVEMVGYILYGVYILGAVVVLINMLIAMMSNTFEEIQKSEDCEWKFARAKLWISFIEQGTTLPIPFNIIPTPKSIMRMTKVIKGFLRCRQGKLDPSFEDNQRVALEYKAVMHRVVLRYIHKMKFENREESLKDEILDTREEVLYQMHSLMSRISYRMEILENDMLAVSKSVQAVTGGPSLTYTKSVPTHGRSSLGSIRHNASSTSLSAQDKPAPPSTGVAHLRRGRSYYHNRPKYKLSDHTIRYNSSDKQSHLTPTTTTTTMTTNNMIIPHTQRSLSDSGCKDNEDDCDLLGPLTPLPVPTFVSETVTNSTRTTAGLGSSHHNCPGQDQGQGQGYLPLIDVTPTSGVTKTIPDTITISTISGNCLDDASQHGEVVDSGQRETDFIHRRGNSIRGSYSPRLGDDRHRAADAVSNIHSKSSNPRWVGQPDVIEESWFEDHPTSPGHTLDVNHAPPLNPLDVGTGLRHCGSVRRRRETMCHHPNIDAPFQPVSDANQGNTFTEYLYTKPKRRETIQNLILDVHNIHNLPGLDIRKESGARTPNTGSSDGGGGSGHCGSTVGRGGGGGERSSMSPPRKSNTFFRKASSKERHNAKLSNTPKSAEEPKRSPWFNWSQPFVMFYGNHSQENLYYPMQMIQQESIGSDDGDFKHGTSNDVPRNTSKSNSNSNKIVSSGNNSSAEQITSCKKDNFPPESATTSLRQIDSIHCDKKIDPTKSSECINLFPDKERITNPTDDDLRQRTVALSHDIKPNATTKPDASNQNRSMSPLTLEETEVNPLDTPRRRPTRKIGMANIQNVNPILLGEKSFFETLLHSGSRPSSNTNRQESIANKNSNTTGETPLNASSFNSNKVDDLKYYDELKRNKLIPVDLAHDSQHPCDDSSVTHSHHEVNVALEPENPINDSLCSRGVAKCHGNTRQQQQQQQHQQQDQNIRRQQLLHQHVHDYDSETGSLEENRTKIFDDNKSNQQTLQTNKFPSATRKSYETDDIVIEFPEMDNPHLDIFTGRHFSDSCVIPLHHHGNNYHHQHQHHNYIQNEHDSQNPSKRLYHQNHRIAHPFPSTSIGDHQRLSTVPGSVNFNDDDGDNDYNDDTSDIMLSRHSAFNDSLPTSNHENRRGITHRNIYIPPMASNLIPFSVVPNSTPVHHYNSSTGCPRTTQDGGEIQEDERQSSGGDDTDRKRKTSSGRKISLVSLVRGRRSDKVKGKQSEIKHNRSFSLNRQRSRSKQLHPQRSKEV